MVKEAPPILLHLVGLGGQREMAMCTPSELRAASIAWTRPALHLPYYVRSSYRQVALNLVLRTG